MKPQYNLHSLNKTITSILSYINNFTRYSFLNSNGLYVSGFTTLNNNTTLLSSLNVNRLKSKDTQLSIEEAKLNALKYDQLQKQKEDLIKPKE